MSLKEFECPQEQGKLLSKGDNLDAARCCIYDGTSGVSFAGLDKCKGGSLKDILPGLAIDVTGFEQEAPDHSTGVERLWKGVKEFFGGHEDTLSDHIKEKVVKDMTPDEKKTYEDEQKAIDAYEAEVRRIGLLMTLNPPPYPDAPDCPMHKEVEKRVQKAEKDIVDKIRSEMTPSERERLDKQMKEYEDGVKESWKIDDPAGTGGGFRRPPEPGNAVKDYWDRVREETERHVGH